MMEDESSQNEDGKQMALKNLLFCDGEEPRVQHDDDSRVKLGENEGNTDSASDNTKAHGSSPSRRSPDPNCAICLGTLENKSFTDSCFHTFCFTCLVEWSKVKAECPLCKQPFKSIVHNVRSIEDYDQYYISSRNTDSSWRGSDGRSFRYRSTLASERWSGRHRYGTFEDSLEYRTHRMIYAPHSVTFAPVRNYIPEYPSTSSFRRHIYESGLWVKPLGDGNTQRYRITSPEFYRQNPACTHRLTPWLNRELLALLYDSESQVTFVLELILALIMRYDIRSEEFYVHIEPYLQHRTSHFIHEFFNFAASLHDMRSYDNCAVYEKLETISENSTNVMSSPGSDVVPITTPSITNSENSPSVIQTVASDLRKRKTKKSSKRQPKLFLRRNQQSNIWQSVLPTSSRSLNSTSSGDSSDYAVSSSIQGFLDLGVVSGPSTSGLQATSVHPKKTARKGFSCVNESSGSSDSDDECVIVDIVKPRALRTPEIVNLVSSSEDERMIDSNDAGECCVATELKETTAQPSQQKEVEGEKVGGERGLKRKLKQHRKRSVNSSILNDFSNCENLFSQEETSSLAPHEQSISSSLSTSVCTRTCVESEENYDASKSQELPLGQDSLDSQLTISGKNILYSSSSTECSQSAFESERTNKNFSKVCFNGEDAPSSISSSSSSLTQTLNKKAESVFSVVAIKQGSEFTFNCKSLSLTQNEQDKRSCEKWQLNNSNSSSSVEESATFEVSENRGKLRSVICKFSTASEKQNSRSDSSHHASNHSKKHKHKKKKKKHKHKHHKHSHSLSD